MCKSAGFVHVECRFEKINDIFQGFEAWCHCDFRKMEALKVNKFGQTYRTGTQAAQAIVVRNYYYFFNLYVSVQLMKRDIVTAVTYFHYAKRGSAYGGVMYGEKR